MESTLLQTISQLAKQRQNLYRDAELNCSKISEKNPELGQSLFMQMKENKRIFEEGLSEISSMKESDESDIQSLNDSILSELAKATPPIYTIVVFGRTGVGKSALINRLIGKNVVKEGHTIISETFTCLSTDFELDGIHVRIVDTPGFGDNRAHVKPRDLLKGIVSFLATIKNVSICLFCLPGTNARIDSHDQKEIELVSAIMGKAITNHFVVAITRMNILQSEQKANAQNIYGQQLQKYKILPQTPRSVLFCDFDNIDKFREDLCEVINQLGTSSFKVSIDPNNEKDLQKALGSAEMRILVQQLERNAVEDYKEANETRQDFEDYRTSEEEETYDKWKHETEMLRNQLEELRLLREEQQKIPDKEVQQLFSEEFSKDGKATLLAESIPGVNNIAGIFHLFAGNVNEAKRAFARKNL